MVLDIIMHNLGIDKLFSCSSSLSAEVLLLYAILDKNESSLPIPLVSLMYLNVFFCIVVTDMTCY